MMFTMVTTTQAPNGRCTLTNCSSSPQFSTRILTTTTTTTKPYFISRNSRTPRKLTLVSNAESKTDSSPPPFNSSSSSSDETIFVGDERIPLEGVIQLDKPNTLSLQFNKWGRVALLSGGDVLALLLFSAIGRFSHGFPVFDAHTLHTADPFIAGWFLSAYFLGGYGTDGTGMNGFSKALAASAKSWALGIPLGIVIRSATSGHIPAVPFMLVTMATTSVLLIGWRALLFTVLPKDKGKKNDVYRHGSPFELFELLTSLVRRW